MLNIEYNNKIFYNEECYVEDEYIGEKISNTKGKFHNENGEIDLEIYSIKGISHDVAVVVTSKNSEKKHLFYNEDYKAKNIEEFIEDFGINEDTTVMYTRLNDYGNNNFSILYNGVKANDLLEGILSNGSLKSVKDYNYGIEKTGLEIMLYIYGLSDRIKITVLENGDLLIEGLYRYKRAQYSGDKETFEYGLELIENLRNNYSGTLERYNH